MPVTPLRRRIPARLLLVGVFVLLALGAGAGAALTPTAAQATGPVYACALKGTGDLRYVTTPECTGRENLVDLVERRDRNGKKLCGRTATGVLRFIFDTSTCQRPEFTLVVPADTPTSICVRNDTGVMRLYDAARGFAPCNPATEFALVVTRPPNLAPVAVALNATALEDGGAVPIVLSATDEDGDPLSFAIVAGPGAGSLADGGGGTTCTERCAEHLHRDRPLHPGRQRLRRRRLHLRGQRRPARFGRGGGRHRRGRRQRRPRFRRRPRRHGRRGLRRLRRGLGQRDDRRPGQRGRPGARLRGRRQRRPRPLRGRPGRRPGRHAELHAGRRRQRQRRRRRPTLRRRRHRQRRRRRQCDPLVHHHRHAPSTTRPVSPPGPA